jgi:selenocysteine lyase/cysteine desulfurase
VQKIQPTMLVCSVHKWLRCPPGMAIVYVSPQLHKVWEPLDMHGRSRDMDGGGGWDASKNEMGPKGYPETFFDDARKFDSGGRPNPLLLPMIRTSLEEVVKLDMPTAQETLRGLTARLLEWATANGYTITRGPHASHIIGLRPKYLTPQEMIGMVKALEQRGIILAVRCGGFRVSSYITTTEGEIDRLMVGLLATTPTRS